MTTKNTAKSEKKQKNHLFKPGQSGNPKGRPQGSRNKVSILLDGMLQEQAAVLLQKAINEALGGDNQTLRALVDKLLPNRKDQPVNVKFPAVKNTGDIARLTASLLKAVGDGDLTPSEAVGLSRVIEAHVKTLELTEMDERLRKLESVIKEKTHE